MIKISQSIPNSYNGEEEISSTNSKALGVLFLAVFVDLLGFGLIIPILPFWVKVQLGQSELMYGFLVATFSIFQFLLAPIWGRISDTYGRRPVILIGLTGTIIGFSMLTFAAFLRTSLIMIFLARAVSGMFTAATLPTSQAFISDSTTGKDRAKGFGLIGAAFGLGFAFGPAIGGIAFFIESEFLFGTGYILPTLIALGFAVINLLVAIRNIPETLTKEVRERRKKAKIERPSRFESIGVIISNPIILLIIIIFTVLNLSFSAMESTFALFGEIRFGLNESGASLVLLIVGIFAIITQGGLVRPLSNKYRDASLVALGYIILVIGFIGLLSTYSLEMMILSSIPLAVGSGLAQPTLGSLLSKKAPKDYQGTVLGINQSMASLMRIFGPLIGTFLLGVESGYPYIFSISLLIVCIVLSIYLIISKRSSSVGSSSCINCGAQLSLGIAKCANCGISISVE